MESSIKSSNEKIIKNKNRVQNHGEVFTPKRIVRKMLDLPRVREACQNLTSTFLEPAAGEGIFLVEILKRKINMVEKNYGKDLTSYENYSLLALSTLYGVELLEDNAQRCVMNMYQAYYESYHKISTKYGKNVKSKVLDSAKLIISKNIVQGNFLTRLSPSGNPLIFNEWKAINLNEEIKILKVQRTEYTLNDILEGVEKENGETLTYTEEVEQLNLFDLYNYEEDFIEEKKRMKFIPIKITDVYKEEKEEVNG